MRRTLAIVTAAFLVGGVVAGAAVPAAGGSRREARPAFGQEIALRLYGPITTLNPGCLGTRDCRSSAGIS
jgi:hypothetical protein